MKNIQKDLFLLKRYRIISFKRVFKEFTFGKKYVNTKYTFQ